MSQLPSAVRQLHTHCSHHLTAIGTTSSSCCRIQEQLYISVFCKNRVFPVRAFHTKPMQLVSLQVKLQWNLWHSSCSRCTTLQCWQLPKATSPEQSVRLTHVCFVFGHSSHCVLVSSKFNVCLSSYSAIWSDFNVYSYRVQRWEELHTEQSQRLKRTNATVWVYSKPFSPEEHCSCRTAAMSPQGAQDPKPCIGEQHVALTL